MFRYVSTGWTCSTHVEAQCASKYTCVVFDWVRVVNLAIRLAQIQQHCVYGTGHWQQADKQEQDGAENLRPSIRQNSHSHNLHVLATSVVLLTNSTQYSPPWEAGRSLGSEEIPRTLWTRTVRYSCHNSPPLVPNPGQKNLLHYLPQHCCNTHLASSNSHLCLGLPSTFTLHFSPLHYPNDTWRAIQIVKHPIMLFSSNSFLLSPA